MPHIWELMFGIVMTWGCVTLGLVFALGRASAWLGITARAKIMKVWSDISSNGNICSVRLSKKF